MDPSHNLSLNLMCYSAQIWAEFRKFEREFGATGASIRRCA